MIVYVYPTIHPYDKKNIGRRVTYKDEFGNEFVGFRYEADEYFKKLHAPKPVVVCVTPRRPK